MKKAKIVSSLFALGLAFSLAACGASTEQAGTTSSADEGSTEQEASVTETEEQEFDENADTDEAAEMAQPEEETGEGAHQGGGPGGQGGPGGPGGNRGGGMVDKTSDAELQAMISEVAPKFELLDFEDSQSGASLQYQLYVPEDYDESVSYPLIQFIPDSSVVGQDAGYVLTQGWGGLIWAADAEQAKHPAFVVVPVFTETVVDDDFNHSDQIDVAVRLIQHLTEQYSIDTKRIYTTGQSMGGMTSFYLNITYPELFAASLFVGSQWDNSLLDILEDRDFFYIVSAGDPKASAGQAGLMEVFDNDNAPYSHAEWSAQDESDVQDKAVGAMLEEDHNANFITFTEGSTLAEGQTAMPGAGEHMTSFDYAYKIGAVRDWLFDQSRE